MKLRLILAVVIFLLVEGGISPIAADDPKPGKEPPNESIEFGAGTGKISKRGRRVLRWELILSSKDGADYISQLVACRAYLALPQETGKLAVIRDLMARPIKFEPFDRKKLNRVWVIDSENVHAEAVAKVLSQPTIPKALIIFIPPEIEEQLVKLEMERARKNGAAGEEGVKLTRFKLAIKDGKPEFTIDEQRLRERKN